jgi:thiol-disulfide isomerase/thioredoxin
MRLNRALQAAALLLALVPACQGWAADGWSTDFDAALAEARRLDKPLLIHLYADWCGPCRQMERNVLSQPAVLREIGRSVIAVRINVDRQPQVASRYGVQALPSDVFVEPDGRKIMEATGYRSLNEYVSSMTRAGTRYADLVAARRPATPPPFADQGPDADTRLAAEQQRQPMLDGYCPVTLWRNRKWEKGSPQFRVEYHDQAFLVASEADVQEFNENPARYAPRFLGCDPVVVWESDRAVLGSTQFGAFYNDQLYLFTSDENRQAFKADPDKFTRTRVVLRVDDIEQPVR